jgi:AcrR family transcriptional regulator
MARGINPKANKDLNSRRVQIIRAAAGLFVRKGILRTTVREIARASGITVGTLLHYINTKTDIISLILEEELGVINDFIREGGDLLLQVGPVEALHQAIDRYFGVVAEIQDLTLFWYQETRNLLPTQRKKILEYEYLFAETFNKILVAGCKSGHFRDHDTLLMSHNIIVLGDMWAFRRWFLRKHYTLAQYTREQIELILSRICNDCP